MYSLTFAELEQVSAGTVSCTEKAEAIGAGAGAVVAVGVGLLSGGIGFLGFAGITTAGGSIGGIAADFAC